MATVAELIVRRECITKTINDLALVIGRLSFESAEDKSLFFETMSKMQGYQQELDNLVETILHSDAETTVMISGKKISVARAVKILHAFSEENTGSFEDDMSNLIYYQSIFDLDAFVVATVWETLSRPKETGEFGMGMNHGWGNVGGFHMMPKGTGRDYREDADMQRVKQQYRGRIELYKTYLIELKAAVRRSNEITEVIL